MKLILEKWKQFLKESTTILPSNKVGKIIYDPKGLGSTPNGTNVDYMGFTVWMKASDFIKLNPIRDSTIDSTEYISKHFQENEDIIIAPPFLSAEWVEDHWKVDGHEGRGRMIEVEKINPGSLVPVHIFPRHGNRARHLTEEMIFATIVADRRAATLFRFQPKVAVWQAELFKK